MLDILNIKHIFFTVLDYPMSHLEFWATISGALAVWLSVRENVWSWILGLVNVCLASIMFYQIQLYPDMFLQGFFFVTNIIGFWWWKFPSFQNSNDKNELKITKLELKISLFLTCGGLLATYFMGTFSRNLHQIFPTLFSLPSAFPYIDSFTTVMSIIATFLLMKKKLEAWWMWLVIDIISSYMYFIKEVKLYSLLYLAFCVIAGFGALDWTRKWRQSPA